LDKNDINNHPLVYVKPSHIHGQGLFAKQKIKAGQVIGEIKGRPTKQDGPHVLWVDDAKKGIRVECIFKYINHRKKPNACYYDDMTVVALKDINKDEEITHDYGDEWGD
jgi:SET domain-containing protein